MKQVFYLALVIALIACNALPSFQKEPLTAGTSCDSPTPTDADLTVALNFGRDVFTDAEWIQ